MIRALPHIVLGFAIAAPANALTPLPACSGVMVNGFETWSSRAWTSEFVSYHGVNNGTRKAFLVLEHCKTGKAVWTDTFRTEGPNEAGDLDAAIEVLYGYLDSDRKYTMGAIKRGMQGKGLKVKHVKVRDESCACSVHFPTLRGDRKPFSR